jgi:membrane associated rhomboid family serine protease
MQQSEPRSLNSPYEDARLLKRSFTIAAAFTALLWLVKIGETVSGANFAPYGIYPGDLQGLAGILWAPLIHSSYAHVFANTAPLLVLGTALLYGYPNSAKIVIPAVYFGTGLGVWLFARQAFHVGASGLTFGFMFFVFVIGTLRWDRRAITLSMLVFFLYGGMIWGVLPGKPDISFESHLAGALLGISLAVLLRNHDPRPPEKRYSWEDDGDDISLNGDEMPDSLESGRRLDPDRSD